MICKKNVQINFTESVDVNASFEFPDMTIKVEMKSPLEGIEVFTASELQELPIRTAIARLQQLLEPTPPTL